MDKKRVLVIATGGTIGMRRDSLSGSLHPSPGVITQFLQTLPPQKYPRTSVIEHTPQIDSSDMGPSEWALIARQICEGYGDHDGFVVVMGTDTMAYAATALAFMLENLNKPVVVTGAMLPLGRVGESDATRNLIVGILVAAGSGIPEVVVVFGNKCLRGCRAKKIDAESMDAFASPNFPPLAVIGTEMLIHRSIVRKLTSRELTIHDRFDGNVVAVRLIPGFNDDGIQLSNREGGLKGLILELYGAGNAPKKHGLIDSVKRAVQDGVLVVVVSQCLRGQVNLTAYASGRQMLDAGAISAGDTTFEACAVKMGYLFGQGMTRDKVAELMRVDLRGELTPEARVEPRFYEILPIRNVDHLVVAAAL